MNKKYSYYVIEDNREGLVRRLNIEGKYGWRVVWVDKKKGRKGEKYIALVENQVPNKLGTRN